MVKLAKQRADFDKAELVVRKLQADLLSYEAIDQVEILTASLLLASQTGRPVARVRALQSRIDERLADLPVAVAHQLKRLGMLGGTS
jgi:hypothetical protein